jgi:hypothetical protein
LLQDDVLCTKVAYVTDVFERLNQVDSSTQGRNKIILSDKTAAFKERRNHVKLK